MLSKNQLKPFFPFQVGFREIFPACIQPVKFLLSSPVLFSQSSPSLPITNYFYAFNKEMKIAAVLQASNQ